LPWPRKKKKKPRNYREIFSFLKEDEQVLRDLERDWQVVRHGRKLSDKTTTFRFDEARKPLLTNKRIILLKGPWGKKKEIDYEIPVNNVKSVDWKLASHDFCFYTPYLRIHLTNEEVVSLVPRIYRQKSTSKK
jgi:hypothetical protein